ncbi:MAG: hypothetical protein NVSMB32_00180 [Actinomycetota bacterium]
MFAAHKCVLAKMLTHSLREALRHGIRVRLQLADPQPHTYVQMTVTAAGPGSPAGAPNLASRSVTPNRRKLDVSVPLSAPGRKLLLHRSRARVHLSVDLVTDGRQMCCPLVPTVHQTVVLRG